MAKSHLPTDASLADEDIPQTDALWNIVMRNNDFSYFLFSLLETATPENWEIRNENERIFMHKLYHQLQMLTKEEKSEYSLAFSILEGDAEEKKSMVMFLKNHDAIAEIFEAHLSTLEKKFPGTKKLPTSIPQEITSPASATAPYLPDILRDYTLQNKLRYLLESPKKFKDRPETIEYNILRIFNTLPEEKRAECYLHLRNHSLDPQILLDQEVGKVLEALRPWLERFQPVEHINGTPHTRMKPLTSREATKRRESVSYYDNGIPLFTLEIPYQTAEEIKEQAYSLANKINELPEEYASLLQLHRNSALELIVIQPVGLHVISSVPHKPVTAKEYNHGLMNDTAALADFLEKEPRARNYISNYLQSLNTVYRLRYHENTDFAPLELSRNSTLQSLITSPHHQLVYRQGIEALNNHIIRPSFIELLAIKPAVENYIDDYERTLPIAPSGAILPNMRIDFQPTRFNPPLVSRFQNRSKSAIQKKPSFIHLAELPEQSGRISRLQNIELLSTLLLSIAENSEEVKTHAEKGSPYDKAIDSVKTAYDQLPENEQATYRQAMAVHNPELFLGSHKDFAEKLQLLYDPLEDLADYYPNRKKITNTDTNHGPNGSPSSIVNKSILDGDRRPGTPQLFAK